MLTVLPRRDGLVDEGSMIPASHRTTAPGIASQHTVSSHNPSGLPDIFQLKLPTLASFRHRAVMSKVSVRPESPGEVVAVLSTLPHGLLLVSESDCVRRYYGWAGRLGSTRNDDQASHAWELTADTDRGSLLRIHASSELARVPFVLRFKSGRFCLWPSPASTCRQFVDGSII